MRGRRWEGSRRGGDRGRRGLCGGVCGGVWAGGRSEVRSRSLGGLFWRGGWRFRRGRVVGNVRAFEFKVLGGL